MTILSGVRIIEFEAIGPAPFCGMLLADLGAEVILIERPGFAHHPLGDLGKADIVKRGKKSLCLDLKADKARDIVLDLLANADGLIEGLRPGVMESLRLGPNDCLSRNPSLVYGRVTGWGQQGPLARSAGHDINYAALSGALSLAGHQNELPLPPPTLVGDVAGGALYLAVGMLAAIMKARETGQGNVVDAAVVDGTAHMMNLVLTMVAAGAVDFQRGNSMMNGAPWYDSYRCACGGAITVGPIESKFYRMLLERLGLENHPAFLNQYNKASWPTQRETLTKVFLGHDVAHWQQVLEGSDVCFAPVLNPIQASEHHHMKARRAYFTSDGYLQAAPAPRFREGWSMSRGPVRERGADSEDILRSLGRSETQIAEMRNEGVIG